MAYNKFAYQRIKSDIPFRQQVLVALFVCFIPFYLMAAVSNEKAPKAADTLIGFGVLSLAVGGGMKLSSRIFNHYN